MAQTLRQSTAVDVLIGPFVDKTDGSTTEAGESPVVELSKNGQALAAKNDITTPVYDSLGYYNCELDATDTATVGTLVLVVEVSANALPVRHEFQVVEEATYDFLFAAGATPIADINAEVATALATYDGPTNAEMEARTIVAASYFDPAADAVATVTTVTNQHTLVEIEDQVWDAVLTGAAHNDATSAGRRLRLVSEVVQVESAVDDPGAAATTTVFNTDLTDADDFWNDSLLVFTSGALAGQARPVLDFANTNGQITLAEALTSIPVNNVTFSIVSDHIHPVTQIAAGVWDKALSGHTDAGSAGKAVADIEVDTGTTLDGKINTIDGIVDTILIDTNELQGDWTNTGRLDTILDSILEDTGTTLQAELDGIQADTEDIQTQIGTAGDGLTDLGGMATGMKAEVNAEVVDVITVDTIAELSQAKPTATPTIATGLMLLYMALRNKVDVTATLKEVHNDAGAVIAKKTLSDDATTYSEAEMAAGP